MAEILSPATLIDSEVTLAKNDNFLDMNQQEIKQIVIHKVTNSTMPATPVNGQMVYNTEKKKFGLYQDGAWAWTEKMPEIIGTANQVLGVINAGGGLEYKTIAGSNCTVVHTANTITITLPQAIETNSNVQFGKVTLAEQVNPANNEAITRAFLQTKISEVQSGVRVRTTCACATTANITTLSGLLLIDGYQLQANDRILVKNQTTASQNGIYVVGAGAWTRAADFDAWAEFVGSHVYVEYGAVNSDCGFMCDAVSGGTLNNTGLNYTIFSKIGRVDAGNGITKTGNEISVKADTNTLGFNGTDLRVKLDANGGLTATADGIKLNIDSAAFELASNVLKLKAGVGVAEQTILLPACTKDVEASIAHTLGKKPKSIRFYKTATGDMVIPEITGVTTTEIKVKFSKTTTNDEYSVDLMAGK